MSAQVAAAPVGEMKASLLVDGLIIPVVEKELPIGTKLYAAPPVAAPEPIAVVYTHLQYSPQEHGRYMSWLRNPSDIAHGTLLYAAPPAPVAAPEPVAWACFYPGGMLNVDLVGTYDDCQFWATSEDRQAQWIVRPLYDSTDRVAQLEGLLREAVNKTYLSADLRERIRAALEGK